MRPFTLHAPSALLGLGLTAAVGLLSAQATVGFPGAPGTRTADPVPPAPHPRDVVRVEAGVPYIVPAGKCLVVTAVGGSESFTDYELRINGTVEVKLDWARGGDSDGRPATYLSSMLALPPPGLVALPRQSVEVSSSGARAWGYLVGM